MYIPTLFREESPEKLTAFMQAHSFATLVSHDGQGSFTSQNRPPEDLFGVYRALTSSDDAGDKALAEEMCKAGYSPEDGIFQKP